MAIATRSGFGTVAGLRAIAVLASLLALPTHATRLVLDGLAPAFDQPVQALAAQADGKLLVGGSFAQVNAQANPYLVRLLPDGTVDASFTPAINGWVGSIVPLADGKVLIGGSFTYSAGGQTRRGIARLTNTGAFDATFLPPVITPHGDGRSVFRVLPLTHGSHAGKILVAGYFLDVGGSGRARLARLGADGALDTAFAPIVLGTAGDYLWNLAEQADGRIFIGGGFSRVNGQAFESLARLLDTGALDASFAAGGVRQNGGVGSVSNILVQADGDVVVTGLFDLARGLASHSAWTVRNIVRFGEDGQLDTTYISAGVGSNAAIHWAELLPDQRLLIGGDFTAASTPGSPIPRSHLALFDSNGSVDSGFDPPPIAGAVYGLTVQPDRRIAIGGTFTQVDGVTRQRIARVIPHAPLRPLTDVAQIETGRDHVCAVTLAGKALCWGRNAGGSIGDGSQIDRLLPVPVAGLGDGVRAITAGGRGGAFDHSCALDAAGSASCWGQNSQGQLGDGSLDGHLVPTSVVGLGNGLTAISAGTDHTCALDAGGAAFCWGWNMGGMLGDGSVTSRRVPTPVRTDTGLGGNGVTAISTGFSHTCALNAAGAAYCWGYNFVGQVGDGTQSSRTTPAPVSGGAFASDTRLISAGRDHTCAVDAAAQMACWGLNGSGQLGDGTSTNRLAPVAVTGLGDVALIASGRYHTCAVDSDDGIACWGENLAGQLGDGTFTQRLTPTPVATGALAHVSAISAYGENTCALGGRGAAYCWGSNDSGQLGDGTLVNRNVPTAVLRPAFDVSASATAGGDIAGHPEQFVDVDAVPQFVDPGERGRFVATPQPGYRIASIGGTCGGTLDGAVFVTEPVTSHCTVVAAFERNPATAPVVAILGNQSQPAGSTGVRTVIGFAHIGSFGSEPWETEQALVAYDVEIVADPAGLLFGTPTVALDGTLGYVLGGASGSAQLRLRARDNGGTANGGVDTSAWQAFAISVGEGLDIAVSLPLVQQLSSFCAFGEYSIVVENVGTVAATAVQVRVPVPSMLADARWTCTAIGGANCAPSGNGAIAHAIDLPRNAGVVYRLVGRFSPRPDSQGTFTAQITAAGDVFAGNDSATAPSTRCLFFDGFDGAAAGQR